MNNGYNFKFKTPSFKAFRVIILKCLVEINNNANNLNNRDNPESLHQMRIAVRKLYIAIQLLAELCPELTSDNLFQHFKQEIKQREVELGKVRDAEVFSNCDLLQGTIKLPTNTCKAIQKKAADRTSDSYKQLIQIVQKPGYKGFWNKIKIWVNKDANISGMLLANKSIGQLCNILFESRQKKLLKYSKVKIAKMPTQKLHKLRIFIKQYHYLISFFIHLYPLQATKKHLQILQKVQYLLGKIQDFMGMSKIINELLSSNTPDTQYAFTLGEMYGWQKYETEFMRLKAKKQFKKLYNLRPFWYLDRIK